MKKKVVSLIMSVALAFSSMHVMNIAAENVKAESNLTEATVTNLNISTGNYEFIDIASNGSTLVALTKTTDKTLGSMEIFLQISDHFAVFISRFKRCHTHLYQKI